MNGRQQEERPRPVVTGDVKRDGTIRCTCGKKVGKAHETQVEFHCDFCNVGVVVDSKILMLRNCEQAIETVKRGIETSQRGMETITEIMAFMEKLNANTMAVETTA
jgi:hypothetical protein